MDSSAMAIIDCIVGTYKDEIVRNNSYFHLRVYNTNYDIIRDDFGGKPEYVFGIKLKDESYVIEHKFSKEGKEDLNYPKGNYRVFHCDRIK